MKNNPKTPPPPLRLPWYKNPKVLLVCAIVGPLVLFELTVGYKVLNEISARNTRRKNDVNTIRMILPNQEFKNKKVISVDNEENGWLKSFTPDALLGHRITANAVVFMYGGCFVSNEQQLLSGSGEINFTFQKPKPVGTYRVVVLGGSTVFGIGATRANETIPGMVYTVLQKIRPKNRIEVINAGLPDNTSEQELLYLMSDLVYYEPDLVIVYDGWNDETVMARKRADGEPYLPYRNTAALYAQDRLNKSYTLRGSMQLLSECFFRASPLLTRVAMAHQRPGKGKPQQPRTYVPESVEIYQQNLEMMIQLCKARKIPVGVFLQPVLGVAGEPPSQLTDPDFVIDREARPKFYQEARKMFEQLKAGRAQSGRVVVKDLSQILKTVPQVYVDTGHVRPQGNWIITQEIIRALMEGGILP